MSILRRIKLRTPDGIESIEYPLGVEAKNVEVANQENLSQRLVRIDEDLEENEEDIAAVSELAGTNKQNIGAAEIRIDALERRSASVDKKPYYFDTVADMKAYQKLIEGDMAITLGYYNVNDGGGAEYKITNTASLNNIQEELDSGLYATLIIENNIIKAEQIGIKGNVVDNSNCNTLMQKLINYASSNNYYIEFINKTYNCYNINIPANTKIRGNGAKFKKPNFKIEPYNLQPNVYGHYELFTFISPNSNDEPLPIYISDCIFDGNCWEIWSIEEGFSQQQSSLITVFGNANYTSRIHAKFYNITVQNSASDGFHIRDNADVYIENAVSNECFRGGLTCTGGGSLVKVNGFEFNGNLVPDGIDLETDSGNTSLNEYYFTNITINNDLDLGLPSNNSLIVIDNMVSKGNCDIKGTLKGTYISNSYFSTSDPTKNFTFSSTGSEYKKLAFTNCIFEGAKNENENTGTFINMTQAYEGDLTTQIKVKIKFDNCDFRNLYTVSGTACRNGQIDFLNCNFDSTMFGGSCIGTTVVTNDSFRPRILNIINCTFNSSNYICLCPGDDLNRWNEIITFKNNIITNSSCRGLKIYRATVIFDQIFFENGYGINWIANSRKRLFGNRKVITSDQTFIPNVSTYKGIEGEDEVMIVSSDYVTALALFKYDIENNSWTTVFNNI